MEDENGLLDDPVEKRVLYAALDSFRRYRDAAHYNVTHARRKAFYALPTAVTQLLSTDEVSLPRLFAAVDNAIDTNATIAEAVVQLGLDSHGIINAEWRGKATPNDMDKAVSTIKQLWREWSDEGAVERDACFGPMLEALNVAYAHVQPSDRHSVNVLVPGAGLGRFPLEICAAGYTVEGNEISYHQLLMSNWILNHSPRANAHDLYPWALNFSNHLSRADQMAKVTVPDVAPGQVLTAGQAATQSKVPPSQRMSISAGDFCLVYKEDDARGTFDAVLTCFFIDTAPNLIAYIEAISNCLKKGGHWINLGPLTWHFEANAETGHEKAQTTGTNREDLGIGEPGSFELTDDEVLAVIGRFGFHVVRHEPVYRPCGYVSDPRSMLQHAYRPSFWVAIKR